MYTNQVITGVTGFDGDNTAVWSYRPQLDVASDWLTWLVGGRGQIAERQASVAYINIGGNDAGFSSAIKQCVLSWECHLPDEHLVRRSSRLFSCTRPTPFQRRRTLR